MKTEVYMNKKIWSIKLGTILICVISVLVSVIIWLLVKYFSACEADVLSLIAADTFRC